MLDTILRPRTLKELVDVPEFWSLQPHLPVFRPTKRVQIQLPGLVKLRHDRDLLHHALVLTHKCDQILLQVARPKLWDPQQHDEKMCLPPKTHKGQGLVDHPTLSFTFLTVLYHVVSWLCCFYPAMSGWSDSNLFEWAAAGYTLQLRSSSPLAWADLTHAAKTLGLGVADPEGV